MARRRPPIPAELRRAVIARDGMKCRYCHQSVRERAAGEGYAPGQIHLDHVHPWSRGGEHSLANLVVSCARCNLGRSVRLARAPLPEGVTQVIYSQPVQRANRPDPERVAYWRELIEQRRARQKLA